MILLMFVALILVGANLYLTWKGGGVPGSAGAADERGGLPAGDLKKLALKLEKQGLSNAAAGVWKEYLDASGDTDVQPSAVWYRIGTSQSRCRWKSSHLANGLWSLWQCY